MSMSNLEQGGWEPGMYWVADGSVQQRELDIRYEAEVIADRTRDTMKVLGDEYEDDELYDREKNVQECIVLVEAHESYSARPLSAILRDTLTWVDATQDENDRYHARHTMEREAVSLLTRTVEHEAERLEVDPELLDMTLQWAALEYFTYNYWRDWDAGTSHEECIETIQKAGLSLKELDKLLQGPKDAEAEKILKENEDMHIYGVNQVALETQMIRRAKEVGWEIGQVHGYGNYLQSWGI